MSSMMDHDGSELAAAREGDADAFARLHRRHAAVVLALCRRQLSLAEAEDACQETFLRAYRRLAQVREPAGLRAWLYAIARRVCADFRRSGRRRDHHTREATDRQMQACVEPAAPDAGLAMTEQLEQLNGALDTLPDDERLAIHLYYLEPDPERAAADVLGLSRGGFYKVLQRARERLARRMKESSVA